MVVVVFLVVVVVVLCGCVGNGGCAFGGLGGRSVWCYDIGLCGGGRGGVDGGWGGGRGGVDGGGGSGVGVCVCFYSVGGGGVCGGVVGGTSEGVTPGRGCIC